MILRDVEIKEYIENGYLIVSEHTEKQLTPNGYDIRIEKVVDRVGENAFSVMTMEYIKMPENVIGTIYLKSRYCRQGMWGSFGLIDAGFEGKLQFTLFGVSEEEIIDLVNRKATIVQVMFQKLGGKVEKTYAERSGNFMFYGIDQK